jgi:hypothetical protein
MVWSWENYKNIMGYSQWKLLGCLLNQWYLNTGKNWIGFLRKFNGWIWLGFPVGCPNETNRWIVLPGVILFFPWNTKLSGHIIDERIVSREELQDTIRFSWCYSFYHLGFMYFLPWSSSRMVVLISDPSVRTTNGWDSNHPQMVVVYGKRWIPH